MPVNLAPARDFNSYIRKFSEEDLLPLFMNRKRSKSNVFQAQLSWFVYDVCTPGTPQHYEYSQQTKIQLPLAVFGAAIAQNNEVAARHLRLLDHDTNGIVRTADNSLIEIPRVNAHEVRRLMRTRLHNETEALLTTHRADEIGGTAEVNPSRKRQLVPAIRYILKLQRDAAAKVSTGCASEKELRVYAEILWEADILFHKLFMEVAKRVHEPTYVQNLRARMRLVGGYKDVVLGRVDASIDEHEEIADALLSMCDAKKRTEEQLSKLSSVHLHSAECELLSILKKNNPSLCTSASVYDTPTLDAILSIA